MEKVNSNDCRTVHISQWSIDTKPKIDHCQNVNILIQKIEVHFDTRDMAISPNYSVVMSALFNKHQRYHKYRQKFYRF